MAPELTLLTPASRPRRQWPKPALIALAGGVLVGFLPHTASQGPLFWGRLAVKAIAALAACSVASWLEERLYTLASERSPGGRFAAALAVPPLGLFGGMAAAFVLGLPILLLGGGPTLGVSLVVGGFWLALAGVGSLTVVVLTSR